MSCLAVCTIPTEKNIEAVCALCTVQYINLYVNAHAHIYYMEMQYIVIRILSRNEFLGGQDGKGEVRPR